MKRVILTLLGVVSTFLCLAQEDVTDIGVLPSTPEAANFEKYGNIPVGNFSGIPQVGIPIHTIKLKNISVPINLSYHSSGIKVDETASNVGLGWVLNASGMISCNTRGNPDFDTYGYANAGNPSQLIYDRYLAGAFQEDQINDDVNPNSDHTLLDDIAAGLIDGEPDLFNFKYPGGLGKFVYDETITPRTIPFKAIKIERINNGAGYRITDERGNVFDFLDRETSLVRPATGSDCDVINAQYPTASITPTWHLSKITTPHNDTIDFTYETISYEYEYISSQQDYTLESDIFGNPSNGCDPLPFKECKNVIDVIVGKRLTSIDSSDGTELTFIYDNQDRLDLDGTNRLSEIRLFFDSQEVDSWTLQHDYFISETTQPSDAYYRLKLNSVTQSGYPAHEFFYDETETLPKRNSFSQDSWGYYNGKANNTFLPAINYKGTFMPGADRAPDFTYTKAGILNRIKYPTGGETLLEYEPNEYWFDGIEINSQVNSSQVLSVNGTATSSPISTQFTVGGTEDAFGTFTFSCGGSFCDPANVPPGDLMVARVVGNGVDIAYDYPYNPSPYGLSTPIVLPPGTYTMTLFASVDGFSGTFRIEWIEETSTAVQENRIGGGLRIKTLTDVPIQGSNVIKEFVYTNPSNTSRSSGFVSYQTKHFSTFSSRFFEEINPPFYVERFCDYFTRHSHNISNVSTINGGYVGYEYVTVLDGVDGANGKSVFKYSSYKDTGEDVMTWPFVPPTSKNWIRGQLLEEIVYRKEGTGYEKSKETTFNYDDRESINLVFENEDNENNILNLRITTIRPYWNSGGTVSEQSILDIGAYWTQASWSTMTSKVEKVYDIEDSSKSLTKTTNFYFENPIHGLLTREVVVASDGNNHITKKFYPDDVDSNESLGLPSLSFAEKTEIDELKIGLNHRIAEPVQTQSIFRGDTITTRTSFKNFGNNLSLVSSKAVLKGSFSSSNAFQNQVKYLSYDEKGNPLETSRDNGPVNSYIWGYNKSRLIAKIENATYSEIASALGVQVSQLKAFDETDIESINNLRSNNIMNKTMITTYTYQPLVGITSITDARGYVTYYEYDSQNRLRYVRDTNNHLLTEHQYNFKN